MNRKEDLLVFIAAAKLRKLGLREETIGHGPSKEKWEAWNPDRRGN